MNKNTKPNKEKIRTKDRGQGNPTSLFLLHDSAKPPVNRKLGFTAIEILIGIVVVVIVFSAAYGPLKSFRDAQVLTSDAENILTLVKEARSQTVFSKNSSQYGVRFEPGRTVLFQGTVFGEPNVNNKEFRLNSNSSILNWSLNGGGQDVVFQRLTGKTSQFGSVTISLKNNPSKVKIINIGEAGTAGMN